MIDSLRIKIKQLWKWVNTPLLHVESALIYRNRLRAIEREIAACLRYQHQLEDYIIENRIAPRERPDDNGQYIERESNA